MALDRTRDWSVLVVGASSMLAGAILSQGRDGLSLTGIAHGQLDGTDVGAYDVVINMAYDPRYMREAYEPALDFDRRVAAAVATGGGHYVMMSTRKIYGPGQEGAIAEDAPARPADAYGRNKLTTEGAVRDLLGPRCTIIRLANVLGFEPGRHTFFGIALENLRRHGRIVLDHNPFIQRDFIPLADCAAGILAIAGRKPSGTYNLGYGTATETGRIATWLIEGFGRGELLVNSMEERDAFLLDISRVKALGVLPEKRMSIRQRCLEIGEQLRNA